MNKDLLKLMKESGCIEISYGVESGDNETLKTIKKGFTSEKAREIIKLTREIGIPQTVNFILGFPFETKKQLNNTINFIKETAPYYDNIQRGDIIIPFPGTEIYEQYKSEYHFENWWLKPNEFLASVHKDEMRPIFKKVLFEDLGQLDKGSSFFRYDKEQRRNLIKAVKEINKIIVKKKAETLNPTSISLLNPVIAIAVTFFLNMSKLLYMANPKLENNILRKIIYYNLRKNKLYLNKRKY